MATTTPQYIPSATEDPDQREVVFDIFRRWGHLQATLDPQSSFFDPKAFAQMRERQEGRYYGLGIQIQNDAEGNVVATGVFEGSPAYKKGLRRGDILAHIGSDDAHGWTPEQAMQNMATGNSSANNSTSSSSSSSGQGALGVQLDAAKANQVMVMQARRIYRLDAVGTIQRTRDKKIEVHIRGIWDSEHVNQNTTSGDPNDLKGTWVYWRQD